MCLVIVDDAIISLSCQIAIFLRLPDTFANDCIYFSDSQESIRRAIHRTSNYPNSFLKIQIYYCLVEIFYFDFLVLRRHDYKLELLAKAAKQRILP